MRTILPVAAKHTMIAGFFLLLSSVVVAQKDSLKNRLGVAYEHTHFDKQFTNDWKITSLEYVRQFKKGALGGRVNYASRFAENGWQAEVDAYPVLSKKMYAYVGAGYSNNVPVFARWKAGTTLYHSFSKGWEAEAGLRYLFFNRNIWVGSAGASKYLGKWLLNLRSYFSLDAITDNTSAFLKATRFLNNEKNILWVEVGSGVSPDESRSIQLNSSFRLISQRINAGTKLYVGTKTVLQLAAGYSRDEYRTNTFGNQFIGSGGLAFLF